jgi:hypothetical protein
MPSHRSALRSSPSRPSTANASSTSRAALSESARATCARAQAQVGHQGPDAVAPIEGDRLPDGLLERRKVARHVRRDRERGPQRHAAGPALEVGARGPAGLLGEVRGPERRRELLRDGDVGLPDPAIAEPREALVDDVLARERRPDGHEEPVRPGRLGLAREPGPGDLQRPVQVAGVERLPRLRAQVGLRRR